MSAQFPEVIDAIAELPECIIDTELVVLDTTGHATWERVRRRSVMRAWEVGCSSRRGGARGLYAPSICWRLMAHDLRRQPLRQRKDRLHKILPTHPRFHYVNDIATHGEALFATAVELGQEGIVAKRGDSPYKAGRQPTWRKIKNPDFYRQEAVLGWRE